MNFYIDLILTERTWSWSLVGIAYLLFTIVVRQFVFRGIVRETKQIDPHVYSAVRSLYQKNSIVGWAVFLISFVLVIVTWIAWERLLVDMRLMVAFAVLLPLLFLLSISCHLRSFVRAVLAILSQRMGVEKEF